MELNKFYNLNSDYKDFDKGIVILVSGDEREGFDITTEMTIGHSYSIYEIPWKFLTIIEEPKQSELKQLLSDFIEKNYPLSDKIKEYNLTFS